MTFSTLLGACSQTDTDENFDSASEAMAIVVKPSAISAHQVKFTLENNSTDGYTYACDVVNGVGNQVISHSAFVAYGLDGVDAEAYGAIFTNKTGRFTCYLYASAEAWSSDTPTGIVGDHAFSTGATAVTITCGALACAAR